MSGIVWMSSLLSNHSIFDKPGLRAKQFGEEWAPARHELDVPSSRVLEAHGRHKNGFVLERSEMTEAVAVFDENYFAKTHEIFMAGPFYAVRGKLAEVLSRFDLGKGGLIPFTIYQADLVTPVDETYFLLNFGARKDTFLPELSEDAQKWIVIKDTGQQLWLVNDFKVDGVVAMSPAAWDGPNLWFEEAIHSKIFMNDALASALIEAGLAEDWRLQPCSVVGAQS